jgi:PD-(D/E)XK endonuclease
MRLVGMTAVLDRCGLEAPDDRPGAGGQEGKDVAAQGANVSIPFGHSPHYDLVADLGGRLLRVQVKSATFFRNGRWEVSVATYGGNQSWTGLVKRFDASRCDYLFVLVGDGRRWFIPSEALGAVAASSSARRSTRSSRWNQGAHSRAHQPIKAPLQSTPSTLGGMSEWLKERRCKRRGTAYAGSNPAPPTPAV